MGRRVNEARARANTISVSDCDVGDVKRDGRGRGACTAGEGTLVNYWHVLQMDGQDRAIGTDLHGVHRDLHDPKNTIWRDPGIKIMYL